ncbi:MAG TPA: PRC-barrel domain containing protein [Chloroflexi bacterium]|nr:PRC-barrel domain containing protein [Chloroflexota bacterium]
MLRSIKSLLGYTVRATDGDVGGAVDFLFDAQYWMVRYMVVETGSWLVGRRVLIPPLVLGTPKWEERALSVSFTRDQVQHSLPVDFDKPVSRQMEEALYAHYGWSPSWVSARAKTAAKVIESAAEDDGGEMGVCAGGFATCTYPRPPIY